MTKEKALDFIEQAEKDNAEEFAYIESVARFNQEKVLHAFRNNHVALRHFAGSTGYSYEDEGKHVLAKVFAESFGAESAIVSPLIASGTHAIAVTLFGLLRPGDTMFSASGMPYDTLVPVILGDNIGSLKEFGVTFDKAELLADGTPDMLAIQKVLSQSQKPAVFFIQRSRGYTWRNSLSVAQIGEMTALVKKLSPHTKVVVDNCYGEFTETLEPTQVGVDVMIGSLIKNPGGGLAPTGGYICGKKQYIDLIANRLTAPGVGVEVGSYQSGYRDYFQGFFMAPHTTLQALKGALLFRSVFSALGFETLPKKGGTISDIICSIQFDDRDKLIKFCQAIQSCSPVDSFAKPEPWDMPGYTDQVIMAAGAFVQGASIELSVDGPMREPYIAYLQGGLSYEHIRIAVRECLQCIA